MHATPRRLGLAAESDVIRQPRPHRIRAARSTETLPPFERLRANWLELLRRIDLEPYRA